MQRKILDVLRDQMLSAASYSFKPRDVPVEMAHNVSPKYGETIERVARETAIGLKNVDVLQHVDENEISESCFRLIQIDFGRAATSLSFSKLVSYFVHKP